MPGRLVPGDVRIGCVKSTRWLCVQGPRFHKAKPAPNPPFGCPARVLLPLHRPPVRPPQAQYSNAVVAELVAGLTPRTVREGLDDLYKRLRKHFFRQSAMSRSALKTHLADVDPVHAGAPGPGVVLSDDEFRHHLFVQIWNQLSAGLIAAFEQFAHILATCYPNMSAAIREQEVRALIKQTATHHP